MCRYNEMTDEELLSGFVQGNLNSDYLMEKYKGLVRKRHVPCF